MSPKAPKDRARAKKAKDLEQVIEQGASGGSDSPGPAKIQPGESPLHYIHRRSRALSDRGNRKRKA